MASRIGKRSAKMTRLKSKKGKAGGLPDADELREGMSAAAKLAALQKKRGFKKRRKAKGRY